MRGRAFTEAEDALVVRYIDGEITGSEGARLAKRRLGSFHQRARLLRERLGKPTRQPRPWTRQEEAAIDAVMLPTSPYVPADFSLPGRTRVAIYNRVVGMRVARHLPVKGRNLTRDRNIRHWHAEGHTCRRIATTLKVHPSTVLRIARRLKLKFRRPVDCMHCPTGPIADQLQDRAA